MLHWTTSWQANERTCKFTHFLSGKQNRNNKNKSMKKGKKTRNRRCEIGAEFFLEMKESSSTAHANKETSRPVPRTRACRRVTGARRTVAGRDFRVLESTALYRAFPLTDWLTDCCTCLPGWLMKRLKDSFTGCCLTYYLFHWLNGYLMHGRSSHLQTGCCTCLPYWLMKRLKHSFTGCCPIACFTDLRATWCTDDRLI
jgi:hypothetical protein